MSMADKGGSAAGAAVPSSLAAWLRRNVGLVEPLSGATISGGWSNITSTVTDACGRTIVVRRPPAGQAGGGAHDVLREAMIMDALGATALPVPVVRGRCGDVSVAGYPFYVMDHVAGTVVRSAEVARAIAPPRRRELGFTLVDVLADLQAVDVDAVGLRVLRRSTPYRQRQLRRWNEQWRAAATRPVPMIDRTAQRLERALQAVAAGADVLVHGDFRFGNIMIDSVRRPDITAVLDWELATTGHALADLGFLGARMNCPAGVLEDGPDPSAVEGFPSFAELTARFESRTGVATTDLPVFVALAAWRWAIIADGIRRRLSRGAMVTGMGGGAAESAAWHHARVELLATFAADLMS